MFETHFLQPLIWGQRISSDRDSKSYLIGPTVKHTVKMCRASKPKIEEHVRDEYVVLTYPVMNMLSVMCFQPDHSQGIYCLRLWHESLYSINHLKNPNVGQAPKGRRGDLKYDCGSFSLLVTYHKKAKDVTGHGGPCESMLSSVPLPLAK